MRINSQRLARKKKQVIDFENCISFDIPQPPQQQLQQQFFQPIINDSIPTSLNSFNVFEEAEEIKEIDSKNLVSGSTVFSGESDQKIEKIEVQNQTNKEKKFSARLVASK